MSTGMKGGLAVILCLIWAGLLMYRFIDEQGPKRVPLTNRSGPASFKSGAETADSDPFLIRPLRSRPSDLPHVPLQNIFAPLESPPPSTAASLPSRKVAVAAPATPTPNPTPAIAAPPAPSEQEIAALQAARQAELARQATIRELNAFRFIGFLDRDGVKQAFLSRGNELFIVSNGEALDGRFVITALNTSSVTIRAESAGVETIIGKSERELVQ